MLQKEEVEQDISNKIVSYLQNLLTREDNVDVTVLPDYYLTQYDGLYSLSFMELVSLCNSINVTVTDCRLKYQIVSRLTLFDSICGILKNYKFPPIPEKQVVDEYRLQLLQPDGFPGNYSPDFAVSKAKHKLDEMQIQLPFLIGNISIISLGNIKLDGKYNTQYCIYPIGYNCQVLYTSIDNPSVEEWYDCWIQEGMDRPLFSIIRKGIVLFSSYDLDDLWKQVQDVCRSKDPTIFIPQVKGEDMFGLTNQIVQLLIECLPGCTQLSTYIFTYYREFIRRLNEISRKEAVIKSIDEKCQAIKTRLVDSCLQKDNLEVDEFSIQEAATYYRDIVREMHAIKRLQSLEMKQRMLAMNEQNQEVLALYSQQLHMIMRSESRAKKGLVVTLKNPNKEKTRRAATMEPVLKRSYTKRDRSAPPTKRVSLRKKEPAPRVITNPFQRSFFSNRELYYQTQLYCMKALANRTKTEEAYSYTPASSPSIPKTSSSFSFRPLSSLPIDHVNTILSMWSFISTFSKVFQLPLVSYTEFEQSILHPADNPLFDSIMSIVLMGCFCQLKALLSQSDRDININGWRPFYNHRVNRYTWPEFARILFVCKLCVDNGMDPARIVRELNDEAHRGIDFFMVVNPISKATKKNGSEMVEREIDDIVRSLKPLSAIQYCHSLALIKRLCSLPCCECCVNPVNKQKYPIYAEIIQKPMDLRLLEFLLLQGEYTQNGEFHKDLFLEDLSLLWKNIKTFFEIDEVMLLQANLIEKEVMALYKSWVEDVTDDRRGPWDEANYYNRGCKLCLESNEEMHDEDLVTCSICEASFHLSCVEPPLLEIPEEGWTCGLCKGFAIQEQWKGKAVKVAPTHPFDIMRHNAAVYEQLPLIPAMGNQTGHTYDYLTMFDPFITNPIFFGYDTSSSEEILHLPFEKRVRQLTCLLATKDPWEMSFESRLAVASTVFDIARDLPEVRHFVDESFLAVNYLNTKCDSIVLNEQETIRHICELMGDLVNLRTGRKKAITKRKREINDPQTLVNHLPATFGNITIFSLGTIQDNPQFADKYMIYPVDYLASIKLPDGVTFYCEILDNNGEPLFQVRNDDGFVRNAQSVQDVWDLVMFDLYPEQNSEVNGAEYFGLTIEEVARSIFQLPNANAFQLPLLYPYPTLQVEDSILTVVHSQWHPACIGYRMTESVCPIDPQIKSPIFFNFTEDTCSYCQFCHMPETESAPLINTTIPDVTASMAHYTSHQEGVLRDFVEVDRDEIEEESWLTTSERSWHEHCEAICHRLLGNTIRQVRKTEVDQLQERVGEIKARAMVNINVSNTSIGVDSKDNEYFQFRGDPSCIFVHSLDNWYVIQSDEELQALIQQLNPSKPSESSLRRALASVQLTRRPSYDPAYFQIVDILQLRAHELLSHVLPSSFQLNAHCETCGCFLQENIQHCTRCHFDFDSTVFPNHTCCPLRTTHPLLGLAKHYLLLIENALHGILITKRMKTLWVPARRAAWAMKCNIDMTCSLVRRAQTVQEVLTCTFLVEHIINKSGISRSYKLSLSSETVQSRIQSISSLLLRIFCLDDLIRYTFVPVENAPEPEPESIPSKRKGVKK